MVYDVVQHFSETILADIDDIPWNIMDVGKYSEPPDGVFGRKRRDVFHYEGNIDDFLKVIAPSIRISRRRQQTFIDKTAEITVDGGARESEFFSRQSSDITRVIENIPEDEFPHLWVLSVASGGSQPLDFLHFQHISNSCNL